MIQLENEKYKYPYTLYKREKYFFPLIAAVLLDVQDGLVYADSIDSPKQIYVEHAFGFSQIFGENLEEFTNELEGYLLVGKEFRADKIRLYSPHVPEFLSGNRDSVKLSQRQRFHLDNKLFSNIKRNINDKYASDIEVRDARLVDVGSIENKFQLVRRFWRCPRDFVEKAKPCMVLYKGELASICYSAAIADGYAEIDIYTLPAFRKHGFASYALKRFIEKCHNSGIHPLWDCFTNNDASMALANSMGFVSHNSPYDFFTINR